MVNSLRFRSSSNRLRAALAVAGVGALVLAAPVLGAPDAPTLTGPGANTNDSTPSIGISSNGGPGAAGTFQWRVDGGAYAPVTSVPLTLPAQADGIHTVEVFEDGTGPGDEGAPASVTFRVDTLAPTLSRNIPSPTGANGWFNTPSVTVTFSCTDPGGSGVVPGSCPANVTFTTNGVHPLAVGPAIDLAGNPSNTLPAASVSIDTVDPGTPVGATPDGYTNVLNPVFTWSQVDDNVGGSGFGSYQLQINTSQTTGGAINVLNILRAPARR